MLGNESFQSEVSSTTLLPQMCLLGKGLSSVGTWLDRWGGLRVLGRRRQLLLDRLTNRAAIGVLACEARHYRLHHCAHFFHRSRGRLSDGRGDRLVDFFL